MGIRGAVVFYFVLFCFVARSGPLVWSGPSGRSGVSVLNVSQRCINDVSIQAGVGLEAQCREVPTLASITSIHSAHMHVSH